MKPLALLLALSVTPAIANADPAKPNVILIFADDLGYAEVGCYGQKKIRTPNIDKLAAEGVRFTQFYSGQAVCAPSRCSLMTGKHQGHAFIRDNRAMKPEGQYPIPEDTVTLPKLLKERGYVTGAAGKWGLGPPASTGDPNKQGFDLFFGYNCQAHAHNHYPTYLWRNDKKITLEGNDGGDTGKTHTHDLFEAEALKFIAENKDKPFFLYLPFTIPHVAVQAPDDWVAEYKGKWDDPPYDGKKGYRPHATPRAAYAAMVTRMDRSVGRILDELKKLKIDENTLVLFSSDNGPTHNVGGADSTFFESAGVFRGLKGSLYEGGIRVPFIARWTGRAPAGRTSDHVCANWDLLPTICQATGASIPKGIDGLDLLPTILGKGEQATHEFLYWEFPSYGGQQAVRQGNWKAVRQNMSRGKIVTELYNLADDISEKNNLAMKHPEIVTRLEKIMKEQHTPSTVFPLPGIEPIPKKEKK